MDNLTIIFTLTITIIVIENLLLITILFIWLKRKCQQCQRNKCIERIFNKLCATCAKKSPKKNSDYQF